MYNDPGPSADGTPNAMARPVANARATQSGVAQWGDVSIAERKRWGSKYTSDVGGVVSPFAWNETASGLDRTTRDRLLYEKEHGGPVSAAVDGVAMRGSLSGDVGLQGGAVRAATSFVPAGYVASAPSMPAPPPKPTAGVALRGGAPPPSAPRPVQAGYAAGKGEEGYWGSSMAAAKTATRARGVGF
jgi:hypothetical protein